MTTPLEEQYRRLLRWYPKAWRRSNGDVLLGTLLDAAEDAGRTAVGAGERRAVMAAALLAHADRAAPRGVRDAAATTALAMAAGSSVVMFVLSSWAPWGTGAYAFRALPFGPFYDVGPLLSVLWVAAIGTALAGRWDLGRWLAAATIPVALLLPALAQVGGFLSPDGATITYSVVCGLLAGFGTPRTRLPLLGAALGSAAVVFTAYAMCRYVAHIWTMFWEPTWLLWDDSISAYLLVVLALAAALLLAIGRLRAAAFVVLLAAAPATSTLVELLIVRAYVQSLNPWPLAILLVLGLGLLSVLNRERVRRSDPTPSSSS